MTINNPHESASAPQRKFLRALQTERELPVTADDPALTKGEAHDLIEALKGTPRPGRNGGRRRREAQPATGVLPQPESRKDVAGNPAGQVLEPALAGRMSFGLDALRVIQSALSCWIGESDGTPEGILLERSISEHLELASERSRWEDQQAALGVLGEGEENGPECPGHPADEFGPMGETRYCDGTCAQAQPQPEQPTTVLGWAQLLEARAEGLS